MRSVRTLVTCIGIAGCTSFPELDALTNDAARKAPYPRLAPFEDIVAVPAPRIDAKTQELIAWRASRLRAKTNEINRADGSDDSRARIAAASDRFEALRPVSEEAGAVPAAE
ncbi:MAG: hypothetical protein AAF667_06945 [Pseudomonadota bacterium]